MIILYYIFVAKVWFLSILPFRLLYIFSDILYFIVYRIIRYRKKVVFRNLHNSFPKKSNKEIKAIARQYYHNLCDIFLEVLKLKGITQKQVKERIKIKNPEVLEELYKAKRSVMSVLAHRSNWEWLGVAGLPVQTKYTILGIAKPLSNEPFDKFLTKIRTRFGMKVVNFKQTLRVLVKLKNELTITVIASDQTPTKSEIEYWTTFLNQDTPVFLGVEKMSISLDIAVVFLNMQRVKRGYYEVEIIKLTDDPKNTAPHEITEQHVRLLEKLIIQHPDNWLWSHKRWKHKKEEAN